MKSPRNFETGVSVREKQYVQLLPEEFLSLPMLSLSDFNYNQRVFTFILLLRKDCVHHRQVKKKYTSYSHRQFPVHPSPYFLARCP